MTKQTEALRIAIEALEDALTKFSTFNEMQHEAIQACKDALESLEKDPPISKEALRMAIDKWKNIFVDERHLNQQETMWWFNQYKMAFGELLNACKDALEQPAQEPVLVNATTHDGQTYKIEVSVKEWQGLSDAEVDDVFNLGHKNFKEFARAIEAKLKEKNNGS